MRIRYEDGRDVVWPRGLRLGLCLMLVDLDTDQEMIRSEAVEVHEGHTVTMDYTRPQHPRAGR